jgi:acid stress-induced BolA-like protein IbaG/YrbA
MRPEQIRELILQGLPDAEVVVQGDDGAHFEARVVSPQFVGRRTLDRHRMVYATLGARVGGEIHALALETLAPGEAGAHG